MDNMSRASMTRTSDTGPHEIHLGQAWQWHTLQLNWLTSLSTDPSMLALRRLFLPSKKCWKPLLYLLNLCEILLHCMRSYHLLVFGVFLIEIVMFQVNDVDNRTSSHPLEQLDLMWCLLKFYILNSILRL